MARKEIPMPEHNADKEYGTRAAAGLKLDQKEVERLAGMNQEERVKATS